MKMLKKFILLMRTIVVISANEQWKR